MNGFPVSDFKISKVYEDIEVGYAHTAIANDLLINEQHALLLRIRKSFDQNGNHVEYTKSYYRAEKYKYSVMFG